MAHDVEKKREARRKYVYERQALPLIAIALTVPEGTLRRWKREAEADGDNWDRARSANTIAGNGLDGFVSDVIEEFVLQYQAAIEQLKTSTELGPAEKAKVLASLGDSFAKTVSTAGRVAPKISELGVAMDTVQRLADFADSRFPNHVPVLLELLAPFGDHLAEIYG